MSSALLCKATRKAIAHNHPAVTLKPSTADGLLTSKINDSGKVLDIQLPDHIILTTITIIDLKMKETFNNSL